MRLAGRERHRRRELAPVAVRVAVIAVVAGLLAGLAGGISDGFWLCVPAVLLAASIASSALGAVWCAAPVLGAAAVAAAAVHRGEMPPVWLIVLVPSACVLVLRSIAGGLRRERDAMQQAALSDPLTGLANRRMLLSMAEYEIARHRRADARLTVVMLDLDGFKLLNDRHGHAAGDQMLRDVAAALSHALRSQDTIARLGGDEFCVIAPETEDPRSLAKKIVSAVAGAANGRDGLCASVGVSVFPDDGSTFEELLRRADDRLLGAKRRLYGTQDRRAA